MATKPKMRLTQSAVQWVKGAHSPEGRRERKVHKHFCPFCGEGVDLYLHSLYLLIGFTLQAWRGPWISHRLRLQNF
jgi:hypothetical protein